MQKVWWLLFISWRINVFRAAPFHCSSIPSWRRSIWHNGNCHNTSLQLLLVREGSPWMCRSQRADSLKGHRGYKAQAQPCSSGHEEPQTAGTKGKEEHTPLVPNSLCVWPEQPQTHSPSSPRQVMLVQAPQVMPCDGEVLSKEGCWARRWLLADPSSILAPGAQQKHSAPLPSLCYLLIDSSCQWLFAFGRLSRRRRGRLGRNGSSSAQEVDRVSFIFTKGEGKSLRRVFPGRK